VAKHLSVLRRFEVTTVQYDGWMELEHHWRECDWRGDVVDGSLPAIMRMATAHAKVCDGKPQPRPEPRQPLSSAGFVPAAWMSQITAALGACYVGTVTDILPGDALMADPVHIGLHAN